MKKGILASLLILAVTVMHAQVGIGTATPEASAAVDITAADKGLLVPRLTYLQRMGIASPATGLLVIQTDSVQGFYYNAGTPAAPNWLNLSAYTLQQNINTNGKFISGDGTNTGLQLAGNGVVVGRGAFAGINSPLTEAGAGSKMIWYPGRAAFRAGLITGAHWNNANIGQASIAMGYNTLAGGIGAIALGYNTTASGNYSTAMGSSVSTNGRTGSFIIGDGETLSGTPNTNDAINQMLMRFANGYRLYTNNDATKPALDIARNGDISYGGTLNMDVRYIIRDVTVDHYTQQGFNCSCASGFQLIGGGGGHRDNNSVASDIKVNYSGPYPGSEKSTWRVIVNNTSGGSRTIRIYAICARVK
jgi:hypothetical protein